MSSPGPLLAGLLITMAPVQQVLWVDAASFLVSAGTLLLIARPFNAPRDEARRAIRNEILDGLRYVLGHPILRNISAMMALIDLAIFFNINTASLRQQIVPNHLLGRVTSIAGVLAWSAIPVGARPAGGRSSAPAAWPWSTASSGP